ncbi:MAG: iron chelate uptake ABC transporter family permease subunit, partial [Clostridiaceae bacterium]|nr:iron chelate uptake ABC transporter family permease subunit [Clostridiaceae bacterium]
CGVDLDPIKKDILLQLRLPRVVLAGAVGASLAVAGAVFQGLFRNPMADSYVIGISSGAALGAVAAMLVGLPAAWGGIGAVPLFAFAGGTATLILVYQMARVGKEVPVMPLLLAGIALSAFLSALVSLLTYFADDRLHQVVFWIMGGLSGATWLKVNIMLPYALLGFGCVYFFYRELNAMLFGEETARHLGIDTEKVKKILLAGSSLMVAAAVSTSGIIGFVGLVVPHFIRLLIGPDHRHLLPASALLGAALLIVTDTLARTIIAPRELPVGIITALLGAPLFIYLLKKRKQLRYFDRPE